MTPIKLYAECYDEETDGTYLVQLEPSEAIAVAHGLLKMEKALTHETIAALEGR